MSVDRNTAHTSSAVFLSTAVPARVCVLTPPPARVRTVGASHAYVFMGALSLHP